MRKVFVLFILALGAIQASEVRASEGQTYLVRPRDRLERVARTYGVTIGEILSANPPRAFIRECIGQRELTLRNGETITICRRVHYGLIVGKTLVIPTPRLIVESENVRLDAENTASQAELTRANEAQNALRQERDALRQERDRLAASNAELAKANAAMAEQNNEFASRWSSARAVADANSANREVGKTEFRETTVIIVVAGSLVVVVFAIIFVWWSRRPLRHLERDRAHLERTRQSVVGEAGDMVEQRRALEEEETRRRLALTEEEDKQRTLRAELTRWNCELDGRNNRANARQRAQSDLTTSLEGRETVCRIREDKAERRTAELDAWQKRLDEEAKEFAGKQHGVEELRRILNSQKAGQDLKDITQAKREEDLVKGFADLSAQQKRLHEEAEARRAELDRLQTEIDGKIRMYDEDIATAIQGAKEDLAAREEDLKGHLGAIRPREEAVAAREQAVDAQETDLGLRTEELQEAKADLERREGSLHVGEQELERRQGGLANQIDAFEQRIAADRAAFQEEMDGARAALAAEVAAAEHLIEVAGGLEKAKNILSRAKKKAEIARALDEREAAVARRELDCETREGGLQAWAERLGDRERRVALAELPRSGLPHRPTLVPEEEPPPSLLSPEPVGRVSDDLGEGSDGEATAAFRPPPGEEIDPRAATHVEINPGPATSVESVDIVGATSLGSSPPEEPQPTATPVLGQPVHETGPHIPVADKPIPHSESSFWCSLCKRDVPMDQMEEHQGLHCGQEKPGPLG